MAEYVVTCRNGPLYLPAPRAALMYLASESSYHRVLRAHDQNWHWAAPAHLSSKAPDAQARQHRRRHDHFASELNQEL
jgi:hypothetical protein